MQKGKLFGKGKNAGTSSGPDIANKKLKTDNIKPDKEKLESMNIRLLEAAKKGKIENAVRLLEAGADVDARDSDRRTPLMHAAYNGHNEMCELLLKKKANLKATDNYGYTALMLAFARDQTKTIDLLKSAMSRETG